MSRFSWLVTAYGIELVVVACIVKSLDNLPTI